MADVTVEAQANVLGLTVHQRATIERTPTVDAHIASGLLAEVDPDSGEVRDEPDYQTWTVPDLQAEIDRRNSTRDDDAAKLTKDGNKQDLVDRLVADDKQS